MENTACVKPCYIRAVRQFQWHDLLSNTCRRRPCQLTFCMPRIFRQDTPDLHQIEPTKLEFPNEEIFQTTMYNVRMYSEKAIGKIPPIAVNDQLSHSNHIIKMQAEEPTREGLQSFMDINTVIVDMMSHLKCDILPDSIPGSDTAGLMYYIQIMFGK